MLSSDGTAGARPTASFETDWGSAGVGKCPMTWEYKGHHLMVAIIDHIPNGWVMFNGDI